jgi:peptidoglycan/xylan/chitin deacetylase (PgdA/CDA1 family)
MLLGVNYHYVATDRPESPRGIFPVTPKELESQLLELGRAFDFISGSDLCRALDDGTSLPQRSCLITFDDGLRSQVELALPILDRLGVPAVFFVSGRPVIERQALHVHKVHRLREDIDEATFAACLDAELNRRGINVGDVAAAATATYRYDHADAARVKYILNAGLATPVREALIDDLFASLHGDEENFWRQTYVTQEDLRMLAERSYLGAHGYGHRMLGLLSEHDARFDLEAGVAALEGVTGHRPRLVSYPYGSAEAVTDATVRIAAEVGLHAGFTMERALNRTLEQPLAFARIDANDAPGGKRPLFGLSGAADFSGGMTPERRRLFDERGATSQ